MRAIVLVALLACTSNQETSVTGQAVAVVVEETGTIRAVFAEASNANRIEEVTSGARPKFHWISISVSGEKADLVRSQEGAVFDLTDASNSVTFEQTYEDVCNPATEDYSRCWLFESYVAGQKDLKGLVSLKIDVATVETTFDVTWEGLTDRFGSPLQWHRHGTQGGVGARLEK